MWSLLFISFINGAFADQSRAQMPKEYFQTCTEDDKSVFPEHNLGNYAYILVVLVLMNAGVAAIRTRILRQKFQQNRISYCCLVICLYWEVAMATLFAIILHQQQAHLQTLGRVLMVYPIINLIWTLYSVDKGNIYPFEKMASLFFQLITVASFWVKIYFPFRIIFTAHSFLSLIQFIYRRYNRKAEKWQKLSSYQCMHIIFFQLAIIFLPTGVIGPFIWYYLFVLTVFGGLINLIVFIPISPTMIGRIIKKCRLSLQRWQDKRNGRLLPNSQVCAICLQEMDAYAVVEKAFQQLQIWFAGQSSLVRTSCGHTFHSTCMKEWMDTHHWFCPMDYKEIPFNSN